MDSARIYDLHARLSERLSRMRNPSSHPQGNAVTDGFELIEDFDELAGVLYTLRSQRPVTDPLRMRVEDLVAGLSGEILFTRHYEKEKDGYKRWLSEYRRIWREELSLFMFCLFYFSASLVVGWAFAVYQPEFLTLIFPQAALENVLEQNQWFKGIQLGPFQAGVDIAVNNIKVSVNCFILSAVLGLGGMIILVFNGMHIGGLFGFCYVNDFDGPLLDFVLSHGPLELTIIVASSFAGMLFGRVFFMRPYSLFALRMKEGARRAGVVLIGILPWLVLAACFEVFVSPWEYLSFTAKMISGLLIAVWFWAWTFWPERPVE